MRLLPCFYIFLALFVNSDRSPEKDAEEFADSWISLTSTTINLLEEAKVISGVAKEILKLAGPIANLIASGLDTTLKPTSPEYIALLKLSQRIGKQFGILESRINASFASLKEDIFMQRYSEKISVNLMTAYGRMAIFLNPKVRKTKEQISRFKEMCTSTSYFAPELLSSFIYESIVKNCKNNPINMEAFAKLLEIIPNCIFGSNDYINRRLNQQKEDIILHFLSLRQSDANEFVNRLERSGGKNYLCTSKYTHALTDLLDEMRHLSVNHDKFKLIYANAPCLTDIVAVANDFKASAVLNFQNLIRKDVGRVTLYAITCANITYGNDKEAMDAFLTPILIKFLNTTAFLAQYSEKALNSTLHSIEHQKIKQIIEQVVPEGNNRNSYKFNSLITDVGFPSQDDVNQIGSMIKNALNGIGHPTYYRQLFISVNHLGTFLRPQDYEVATYCPVDDCDTITTRKIFVMNARFNLTRRDRTYGLRQNVDQLNQNITTYLDDNYWIELKDIKNYVLKNFQAIDQDFQRHLFIARATDAHLSRDSITFVEYYLAGEGLNEQRSAWPVIYREQGLTVKGRNYHFWFAL